MKIPFTQFKMPDGREVLVDIDRPEPIGRMARQLIEYGCVFEIEVLSTTEISMTCRTGEYVMAHELCANGPAVPVCVDKIITTAHESLPPSRP